MEGYLHAQFLSYPLMLKPNIATMSIGSSPMFY
jgi:hypothetical protein